MAVDAAISAQDAQPHQPRDAVRAQPAARVQGPRERRAHERLHARGDSRGAAAGGGVLRSARGRRGVQARSRGDGRIRPGEKKRLAAAQWLRPLPSRNWISWMRWVFLTVPAVRSKRTLKNM